ncbi:hypothetical protein HKX48_006880 [Thoreauomyces humboldtii]|nr:hypothetical protein HKX48_006880 [Thoreauomyces humboldtii]
MSSRLHRLLSPRSPYPYLVAATAGLAWWSTVVYRNISSQKSHTGIFKAVMFHVRHDARAAQLLGSDILHDPLTHPAIKGRANMMKGNADVEFVVAGDKGEGTVRFRGRRQGEVWVSETFDLTTKDGAEVVAFD